MITCNMCRLMFLHSRCTIAAGPSPVSAFDQSEVEATPEPAPVPKRKTIIIKRSSKASQQWRAPRAKASNQDSETLLKAVRETLEWYFR